MLLNLRNPVQSTYLRVWNTDLTDLRGLRGFCPRKLLNGEIFSHERIRKIRVNPQNPC
ncbi:MAG: hypothetical protein FWG87_04275 [Defluviitaleaceae bacterium]|nr:hypothetical protein [Defluviitaleaceae bacterium]